MNEKKERPEYFYELAGALIIDGAKIATLQAVVEELAQRAGVDSIDGVPLRDWIAERTRRNMMETTFLIEDLSPEEAAKLQAALDRGKAAVKKHRRDQGNAH